MTTTKLQAPTIDFNDLTTVVATTSGGTTADNAPQAVVNLGGVSKTTAGQAGGPVPINSSGEIDSIYFDLSSGMYVSVTGPNTLNANQQGQYVITNFDSFKNYSLIAIGGTVTRSGDIITYTAPNEGGPKGFRINNRPIIVNVNYTAAVVAKPIISSQVLTTTAELTSSAFALTAGVDTHLSTDWQLATDTNFSAIVQQLTNSTSNKTSWSLTGLTQNTTYYVRVRYKTANNVYSAWSSTYSILTLVNNVVVKPSITSPANSSNSVSVAPTLIASAFSTSTGADTHEGTDWQVSIDPGFATTVVSVVNSSANKLSLPVTSLLNNTSYFARVRFKGTVLGYSAWSDNIVFTTAVGLVNTPIWISNPGDPSVDSFSSETIINRASAFVSNSGGVHEATDWKIEKFENGVYTTVGESLNDTVNKTQWTFTGLTVSSNYLRTVRYKDSILGWSAWSSVSPNPLINLMTRSYFVPMLEMQEIVGPTIGQVGGNIVLDNTGNRLVVSNSANNEVYVYYKAASIWELEATLTPGDIGGAVQFGRAIDINSAGDLIVVTNREQLDSVNHPSVRGYFYIFERSGTNWIQTSKVTSTDLSTFVDEDYDFGKSVSISGDGTRIALGTPGIGSSAFGIGHTYIFTDNGTSWVQEAKLDNPMTNTTQGFEFGACVKLDNTGLRLAVITSNNVSGVTRAGNTYVYKRTVSAWNLEATLDSGAGSSAYETFEGSLDFDLNATKLVIGFPNRDNLDGTYGLIRIYSRTNSIWTLDQSMKGGKFLGLSAVINDAGNSIATKGMVPGDTISTGKLSSVNLYKKLGSVWSLMYSVIPSDIEININDSPTYYAYFNNNSLALSGDGSTLAVGEKDHQVHIDAFSDTNKGSIYMFK